MPILLRDLNLIDPTKRTFDNTHSNDLHASKCCLISLTPVWATVGIPTVLSISNKWSKFSHYI